MLCLTHKISDRLLPRSADYPPLKRIELTEYQKAALARFHESNDALDDRKIDKEGDL
jgi:hypothetical protein